MKEWSRFLGVKDGGDVAAFAIRMGLQGLKVLVMLGGDSGALLQPGPDG